MADKPDALLFVYNADSGLFNTLTDIAHKIFSPGTYACSLCQITHGNFRMRDEWRDFLDAFEIPCEFLHKDEAADLLPGFHDYPAVFRKKNEELVVCLSSQEIDACNGVGELQSAITEKCVACKQQS